MIFAFTITLHAKWLITPTFTATKTTVKRRGLLFVFLIPCFFSCLHVNAQSDISITVNIEQPKGNDACILISGTQNSDSVYFSVWKDILDTKAGLYAAKPTYRSEIKKLKEFMALYSFPQKDFEEKAPIHRMVNGKDSVTGYIYNVQTDGTRTEGVYKHGNVSESFQFYWIHDGNENYNLLKVIFEILEDTFTDPKTKKYIKELKADLNIRP
jgi:hypothetical protein